MKKINFISLLIIALSLEVNAQTYQVISRNNDTIQLFPNGIGAALKSAIPGLSESNYRMIKKTEDGKESILFVEFVAIADKFLISYETNMVTAGYWKYKLHSLVDVYNQLKRVNAIYLEGEYLGMKIQVHQRPDKFSDVMYIDGTQLILPLKIAAIDGMRMAAEQKEQKELEKESQKAKAAEERESKIETQNSTNEIAILTDNDIKEAEANECLYYIAYLFKTGKFNKEYLDEVKATYEWSKVTEVSTKYTEEQLIYLTQNIKGDCIKYAVK